MLQRIHIKNGFKHLDSTFDFLGGLTSITGQNESGKSLIMEFVRYALWGTAALRGSAGDYKKLEVTLSFRVKEENYKVYRGKGQARLWGETGPDEWNDIATGTIPVNGAIKNLFGYDMVVFDIANCCLQGKVEELGNMKPTERKKMVDQTIGLQFIDKVIEWTTAEAAAAKRASAVLNTAAAREPVAPAPFNMEQPTPPLEALFVHEPLDKLRADHKTLNELRTKRLQLEAVMASSLPAIPVPPVPVDVPTEGILVEAQDRRRVAMSNLTSLQKQLASVQESPYTAEQLDQFEQTINVNAQCRHKKTLLASGTLSCPSCKHTWPVRADELSKFEGVPDEEVALPQGVNAASIRQWRGVLDGAARKVELTQEIADAQALIAGLPDRTADLQLRRTYDSSLITYSQLKKRYDHQLVERAEKERELALLPPTADMDTELQSLQSTIEQVVAAKSKTAAFEQAQKVYFQQKEAHAAIVAQYEEAVKVHQQTVEEAKNEEANARHFANGVTALKDLKVKIKKFLVPSLNKVASGLIFQMTGGKRSSISVDEDFNIQVDGQELGTLSGSGKAVANLAIRIGLGQVLTNKVFSVFMADEFDAAMDAERAEYTAECLANLAKEIGQVVLISHKRPKADHYIELR